MSNVAFLTLPTEAEALMNRRSAATEGCFRLIRSGADSLDLFPRRLIEAFEVEAWKDHLTPNKAVVACADFLEWITAPFPKGIQSDADTVKLILTNATDRGVANRAAELFDKAQRRGPGGANNAAGINQHSEVVTVYNVHGDQHSDGTRPTGNSSAAGLRRLEREATKDTEDASKAQRQLDDVRAGRATVHGALVNLGIRKGTKPAADPLSDAEAAERQVAALMSAWNRSCADARAEFLLRIENER